MLIIYISRPYKVENLSIYDTKYNYIQYKLNMAAISTFGCRSPKSQGVGYWDGAFVYVDIGTTSICGMFDNHMDYVSDYDIPICDVMKQYNELISSGWIPMISEDIEKTAGVQINTKTNLHPPKPVQNENLWEIF